MHSGAGYNGSYVNPEAGYATNAYHASYGMNPMNPVRFCFSIHLKFMRPSVTCSYL